MSDVDQGLAIVFAFFVGFAVGFCVVAQSDGVATVNDCGTSKCATYEKRVYEMREVKP